MGHLIHRQILELKFASREQAQRWSPQLSELNRQQVLPELERAFSQLVGERENLRIEQLDIDLGSFRQGQLETELAGRLREKLGAALQPYLAVDEKPADSIFAAALKKQPQKSAPENEPLGSDSLIELFSLFWQSGRLPWWLDRDLSAQLDALYRRLWQVDPQRARPLVQQVLVGPLQRRRFIEQFSLRSHQETLLQLLPESLARLLIDMRRLAAVLLSREQSAEQARTSSYEVAYQLLGEIRLGSKDQRLQLTRKFFLDLAAWSGVPYAQLLAGLDRTAGRSRVSYDTLELLGQLLRADASLADPRGRPASFRRQRHEREDEELQSAVEPEEGGQKQDQGPEVAIDNAGLVLLWPYLTELLRKLELMAKTATGTERPVPTAVLLLQQLVSGTPAGQEDRLALNKLLCGIPATTPVPRRMRRNKQWDDEVFAMLSAVIGHWSALKNTSLDGFRSSFLQRPGLLRETESGWFLQVERTSYDVLLEQLPWGIGMIQFSWMRQPLQVEW